MNTKDITNSLTIIILVGLGIFLNGCTEQPDPYLPLPHPNQTVPISNNTPVPPIDVPISGVILNNVVDANNQFASDLYSRYSLMDGNIFFSPYSIASALTMTYEGANGRTAEEMQNVLHLPDSKDTIHSGFIDINTELNKADKKYILSVANALWTQKEYSFVQEYLDAVETYYGGKATDLDFEKETEKSRVTINDWVEDRTSGKIKDSIPIGAVDTNTRLVLTNAMYFKANWSNKFSADDTDDRAFKLDSGSDVTVRMMHIESFFNYSETDDMQMLEMDYLGNDLSMLIILPKDNDMTHVEEMFSLEQLDTWKRGMNRESVYVSLPKFKFESKYFMAEDLVDMGMPTAFNPDFADFKGISPGKDGENLYISEVIHQTFIEVAENGTEAAAATAVVMAGITSIPIEPPKVFNADHPFIFIIQQKDSGNILFMGRLSNPRW